VGGGSEEEDFCPRIFTDWHGWKRGEIGLSAVGYVFLLLSYPAISLSSKKRKNAVLVD
jgi:hypothetical protein